MVLVTHDLAEAAFFAHRVVLMRDGQVVQERQPGGLWRTRWMRSSPGSSGPAGTGGAF